jgi:hypothetical protein
MHNTNPGIIESSDVLYIHPKTDMLVAEILPLSLPALINRLPAPCTGRFYDEWTEKEVKNARIIIMDIHWYLGLSSAIDLAHRFKLINPKIKLIVGGLTASIFAKQLLRDAPIDYVICGDAEVPLSQLVATLLENRSVTAIPNLLMRDFTSAATYTLTPTDLDENDFTDISFFPEFERRILAYHQMYDSRAPITLAVYPYLVVFRGCPLTCPICSGSTELQPKLMGRNWVLRSAAKVQADLAHWSQDDRIKFVNIFHDFITVLPMEYTRQVLTDKYALSLSIYDFFSQPSEEALALLLQAFNGGKLSFALDTCHNTTSQITNTESLAARIRQAQAHGGYKVVLNYIGRFLHDPEYYAALCAVQRTTGVAIQRADWWWWDDFPLPDAGEAEYQYFLQTAKRYRVVNLAFRAGMAGYRLWPRLFQAASQRLWALDARTFTPLPKVKTKKRMF